MLSADFSLASFRLLSIEGIILARPEVRALIEDLGLVRGAPVMISGHDADFLAEIKKEREYQHNVLLCRELYLRNKKFSRYVHASYCSKSKVSRNRQDEAATGSLW